MQQPIIDSLDLNLELLPAKLAEQSGRYDDMVRFIKKAAEKSGDLPQEGRNMLSFAYKGFINARRSSWNILKTIEKKASKKGKNEKYRLAKEYRKTIEKELRSTCTELLELLEKILLPKAESNDEVQIFYNKMSGDYARYLAEISTDDEFTHFAMHSEYHYQIAMDLANNSLNPIHPLLLGVALNFSVFYHEIAEEKDKACLLAQIVIEEALSAIKDIGIQEFQTSRRESLMILQLIHDNLAQWTNVGPLNQHEASLGEQDFGEAVAASNPSNPEDPQNADEQPDQDEAMIPD